MQLNRFDLNLLIALDALLHEKNVTRAAERVFLSQPAMSASLQKLRDYFQDALLVRVGREMELTPRALSLVQPVREALLKVQATLGTQPTFDPATVRRTYTVIATDEAIPELVPRVLGRLAREAPQIQCHVEQVSQTSLTRLSYGDADLCLSLDITKLYGLGEFPETLKFMALRPVRWVCVMSKDMAFPADTMTLAALAAELDGRDDEADRGYRAALALGPGEDLVAPSPREGIARLAALDADALVVAQKMRRGERAGAHAERGEERNQMRNRGSLAIGASHRDDGISDGPDAQCVCDATDPRKIQIDALRVHRLLQPQPLFERPHGLGPAASGGDRGQFQEHPQQGCDLVAHVAAVDDHVDGAVIEQELTALETLRQGFAHGLLDDTRTCEADKRSRFGDVEVAKQRQARRYAAGGRVGEHRDERQVRLREA